MNTEIQSALLFLFLQPDRGFFVTSMRSKRFRRVGEQRKTEERDFRCFARAKNGARAKKGKMGVGEGKEENACRQTPGF